MSAAPAGGPAWLLCGAPVVARWSHARSTAPTCGPGASGLIVREEIREQGAGGGVVSGEEGG